MEEHVAGAVIRAVTPIFAPVGGIGYHRVWPEHGLDVVCQLAERVNERKGVRLVPERCKTTQFRADHEPVDTACGLGKCGMVQDHAAIAVIATAPADRTSRDVNLPGCRGAAEGRHVGAYLRASVGRSLLAGRRIASDPAAPRKSCLF